MMDDKYLLILITKPIYCDKDSLLWTIIVFLGSISLTLLLFARTCTVQSYLFHAFLDHYMIAYKNAVPVTLWLR